jgi:beta-xylosidase
MFAGESPFQLASPPGLRNPVLTHHDVTDVQAAFVADPFMVRKGGLWHMFFEIMMADPARGVIGLAVSSDARRWTYRSVVVEEPFHLSYPYVFQWHGTYYMIPETLDAGYIRLYRAVSFPERWVHAADLVKGSFADASILRHQGRWWIFACGTPYRHDQLRLFHSRQLTGPWLEHRQSPLIDGDARVARPGGRLMRWRGHWVRYAQDCVPTYGSQVRAFQITSLTPEDYREKPVTEGPVLAPNGEPWTACGVHHLDPHPDGTGGWIACVDGHGHPRAVSQLP